MHNNRSRGFTLIELLVVIAIIGILSAVVLASLNQARTKGSDAAVKSDLDTVRTQAELYYDSNGNKYGGTARAGVDCGVLANQSAGTMLADPTISQALIQARNTNGSQALYCNMDATGVHYAIFAPLSTSGTGWCIDDSGVARGTTTGGTAYANAAAALSNGTDYTCN